MYKKNDEILSKLISKDIDTFLLPELFFGKSGQLERHLVNDLVSNKSVVFETVIGALHVSSDMKFALNEKELERWGINRANFLITKHANDDKLLQKVFNSFIRVNDCFYL